MNDTTTSTPGERDVRQQVPLWRLTGKFKLLTPLHIGTGRDAEIRLDEERMGSDKENRAQDESRYVATVVRDHQHRPCIPASSFKGALAALARRVDGIDAAQHERLFGAVKGDKTVSGGVEFTYLYATPDSLVQAAETPLPQFNREGHPHVANLAHVSRNRDTGAAEAQRLFLSQVVPPGVVFGFDCTARGLSREDMGVLLGLLALAGDAREGLRLGAGKAADQGRVSWQPGDVWCLEAGRLAALWASDDGRIWTDRTRVRDLKTINQTVASGDWLRLDGLALKFHSPFLVYERRKKEVTGDPDGGPRLNHAGRAVLPSTSLHGALRAQAERILRTIGLEIPAGYEVPGVQGLDDAGGTLDLASVLFGAPGWRSLLRCSDFVDDGTSQDITHHMLAIDRLTGGGKDSAKFSITVRDCPTLNGSLALDMHRLDAIEAKREGVKAQVLGLLAHVLRDLDEGDVPLGYGAAKGYGQLRSETVAALRRVLPDLENCLTAFAALPTSATTAPAMSLKEPDVSTEPKPVRPSGSSTGPGREPLFHNPYAFIPISDVRMDDPRLPWADSAMLAIGKAAHHSHSRYDPNALHGRLVCRVKAVTPIFVGAGDAPGTRDPREQLNYRLGGELAIPATTLRGLFSSLHESITASALRVMTQRSYSVRASTHQTLQHKGELVNRSRPHPDGRPREVLMVRNIESGQEFGFGRAVMDRLYELADERTAAMKEQHGSVSADKAQPEVKPKGVPRNPKPERLGLQARFVAGQRVFFNLSEDGKTITEIAWSQIWRKRVETSDLQPWRTAQGLPGQGGVLAPVADAARSLSPSELLFGAVQIRDDTRKKAGVPGCAPVAAPQIAAWASKVRFGAARALTQPDRAPKTDPLVTLKILSSPKPPSPSLYLQRIGQARDGYISKADLTKNPEHYQFKGRKVYLHALRDLSQAFPRVQRFNDKGEVSAEGYLPWESNTRLPPPVRNQRDARGKPEALPDPNKQKVRVRPISAGSEFMFEIDFVNLSQAELETLCACLAPHGGFEHKLGMGKPIGLGSVKVEPVALYLVDRPMRYRQTDLSGAGRYQAVWRGGLEEAAIKHLPAHLKSDWQGAQFVTSTVAPVLLARAQMQRVQKERPDVYQALVLTGLPYMVTRPVHYPQVANVFIEQETYRWFVENDRIGSKINRQSLERFTATSRTLPELRRMMGA